MPKAGVKSLREAVRESIFMYRPPAGETVAVGEWGVSIDICVMDVGGRAILEAQMLDIEGEEKALTAFRDLRPNLIIAACYADGEKLFGWDEKAKVRGIPVGIANKLCRAVNRVNRLDIDLSLLGGMAGKDPAARAVLAKDAVKESEGNRG